MSLRALLAAAALALAAAPSAHAATWKQLTSAGGANIDQVGLLRTADGVLHVAWHRRTGPNTEDLMHTAISPGGTIGATSAIVTGWVGVQNAALVAAPGGLRAFWGGQRSIDTNDPNQDLNTALSADGGATWALQEGSIVPQGGQAYGSPASATVLPNGTPLEAWAGTLGTWVHAGLSPASPNFNYQTPLGNYGYDTGIASDAAGRAVMAWYSNATGHLGVYAQGVAADGSPIGGPANMPGTSDMLVGMLARTPIVARPGGGFYVAYPAGYPALNQVRLWLVGTPSSTLIARADRNGSTLAALAADAKGRLWVAWKRQSGGTPRVLVTRSNRAATRFGAVVDAGQPRKASSLYRIDASAAPGGGLDLMGAFARGVDPGVATYDTRVLPGLTLDADPGRLRRGRTTAVEFRVTDAGDPVKGAKVRAGGRSGTTNAAGRVTLRLAGRRTTATAAAPGYTEASRRLPAGPAH